MSKERLLEILRKVYTHKFAPDDAQELIWAKPFDGETEKIVKPLESEWWEVL